MYNLNWSRKDTKWRAVDAYYASPNFCCNCNKLILIRDDEQPCQTKQKKFCNHSCSASFNNKKVPKRRWTCNRCGLEKTRPSKHARVCEDCKKPSIKLGDDFTVGEIRDRYKNSKYGRMNVHTLIRDRARHLLKRLDASSCMICSYDKHVDAAHIKPIVDFDAKALISEVNALTNLLALCRNHHWELDHGLISLEEIKSFFILL